MIYEGTVIRPPSEANSLLLQVTIGCSHNKCAFCGTYLDKKFRIKPLQEVFSDIDYCRKYYSSVKRVFLCDGNALILKTETLLKILERLKGSFSELTRVGIYANANDILNKSFEELRVLRENKLGIIYLGLESGSDKVLKFVNKGITSQEMIKAVRLAQDAGIKMSVIALLGLGGRHCSEEHAIETAKVLNQMNPKFVSFLTLMIIKDTPLYYKVKKGSPREIGHISLDKSRRTNLISRGEFELPSPEEMLKELRLIVENLDLKQSIFRTNHASNYLPLGGTFPKDKQKILNQIDMCLEGKITIRPEVVRGL